MSRLQKTLLNAIILAAIMITLWALGILRAAPPLYSR